MLATLLLVCMLGYHNINVCQAAVCVHKEQQKMLCKYNT